MSSDRDVTRIVRSWIREDGHESADRVLDSVLDQLDTTPQRRAGWPARRTPTMNKFVVFGLGAAAVVVLLFVGAQLFGSPSGGTGGPGATPTATPEPTTPEPTTPEPDAEFPSWYPPAAVADANGAGILSSGTHTTKAFDPGFSFSAPEGWVNAYDEPRYFTLFPDTPENETAFARSEELARHVLMGPQSSPWFTCESAESNGGATAAEIVAAASANEALAVSDPVEVAIGGLTGAQIDVRRNPDWTGTCPGDSDLPEGIDPEDERTRAIMLDVPDGEVLVIFVYSASSGEHDAFVAEAMSIVESFQFSP
jgi:hypothetical protein